MERFAFSNPMIISPGDMDEMIESSVPRNTFTSAGAAEPIVEPYEGMKFESEDAARSFYYEYASQMGFKVRVSSFVRSKRDKTIISRQLVCFREGFRSAKDGNSQVRTKRPRMITRVGCRAMIMVKKQSSGKWIISKCENIHNHLLGTLGKVVILDFDPYGRANEALESQTWRETNVHRDVASDPHELVVVPSEMDPHLEPHEGMEFESEQAAQTFYKEYARRAGFRARISTYYRSKRDNSIISRLIVCSKEGFRSKKDDNAEERLRPRAITRVGCKAMIMVKKRGSRNWVVSKLVKQHNHLLIARHVEDDDGSDVEGDETIESEEGLPSQSGDVIAEPHGGMEFESEEGARQFYNAYSKRMGFNMRVSTYYRSKRDKSIISRLFVCSKEGFHLKKDTISEGSSRRSKEATRVGCKAMLLVKKSNYGKWVVSKCENEHNHPLGSLRKMHKLRKRKHLCGTSKKHEDQLENYQNSYESATSQYNILCHEASKYAESGVTSTDLYNVAIHTLQQAVKKVSSIKSLEVSKSGTVIIGDDVDDTSYQDSHVETSASYDFESARRLNFSDR
ncbi:uncharacterized protein LOC110111362 isoform X2 [Dendrobium catenatum]|uniref:Protein FAR1-RELATED SEQUENCE 7 n=2 Tax=Dendrobium catenatum TaxID=906689 RepID=A0A2I0WH30_9ASPA|nr:uncharacterized protein LOC110111362 isoform X2 [Dendrobium catenatum]PKU74948.1 Protein FAR1-RELATED SEQUENCE 7 [Dendrobium catenatum]